MPHNQSCNNGNAIPPPNVQRNLTFTDQPSPHEQNSSHINLEAVLNDIYSKLNQLDAIPSLLCHLESLPSIDRRLGGIESKFVHFETELNNLKTDMKQLENRLTGTDHSTTHLRQRLEFLQEERNSAKRENEELRERILDMQARSMRENLLFGGIEEDEAEKNDPDNTKTELVLKNFLKKDMGIAEDIKFHIVHRLRPRQDGKPRTIIAKFERRKDRDMVLKSAPGKLKDTRYSVYEQFPTEIMERRNILWPVFKREQRMGSNVRFKGDKLFVNGRRIFPDDVINNEQIRPFANPAEYGHRNPHGHPYLNRHFGPPQNPALGADNGAN